MMARSSIAPSTGRIQKRKTNVLQIIIFGLQRAAGPYRWVIREQFALVAQCQLIGLSRTTIAVRFERSHKMRGAIEQAYLVRRIFIYDGHARVVEALRNRHAFGH
jgi:hypothetical protein